MSERDKHLVLPKSVTVTPTVAQLRMDADVEGCTECLMSSCRREPVERQLLLEEKSLIFLHRATQLYYTVCSAGFQY